MRSELQFVTVYTAEAQESEREEMRDIQYRIRQQSGGTIRAGDKQRWGAALIRHGEQRERCQHAVAAYAAGNLARRRCENAGRVSRS